MNMTSLHHLRSGTLVQQLNLENRILFHKPIPLREMAKVIETTDLGIAPKRKDTFGRIPNSSPKEYLGT